MGKTQTAVEYLMDKLTWEDEEDGARYNAFLDYVDLKEHCIKAKAMEKEQIIDAFINGEHQQGFQNEPEQYYDNNYGNANN